MSFKDILVPLLSVAEDEPALSAAETIADSFDAHIGALLLEVQPEPIFTPDGSMAPVVWPELLAQTHKEFEAEKQKLERRAVQGARPINVQDNTVLPDLIGRDIGVAARYADLTVMVRPEENWRRELRTRLVEGVLFGAGRPLVLAPPKWRQGAIGRNIVVAWNGKREAARALGDALPFLVRADAITIVTVGAGRDDSSVGSSSGNNVVSHLKRRGLSAAWRNVDDLGLGEAHALFAEAAALRADLVVMGGYGRSRLGELIFGGVTHHALKAAEIPILMSH